MDRRWVLALCAAGVWVFSALNSAPARADVTVTGRYVLVQGDTIVRNTYYAGNRMRATGPDGTEYLYEKKTKQVTIVDHQNRMIHIAPVARADSIAAQILLASRKEMSETVGAEREAWEQRVRAFNDSVQVMKTEERRTIAGKPTQKWILSVDPYMRHERWVARSMDVPDFAPELERIVLASMVDPGNRLLVKMLLGMRTTSGMAMAATTTFKTPTDEGGFSFEALQVKSGPLPDSAFALPKDYVEKRH